MKKFLFGFIAFLAIAFAVCAQTDPLNTANYPTPTCTGFASNVWITGPMVKVLQNTGSPGTTQCATAYATQNQFADFQLFVQAPGGGYSSLTVTMSNLVGPNPANSTTISAATNSIVVYTEGYIDILHATAGAGNPAYIISGTQTGFVPDPLTPLVDPYYGQTTNAQPVNVTAGNNQGFWIDVHIPPTAPSGFYSGTVTIKNSGTSIAALPVVVGVWQGDFPGGGYMPSTSGLPVMEDATNEGDDVCNGFYGGYSACSAYPGAASNSDHAVSLGFQQAAVVMLDHRMSWAAPIYPPTATPVGGNWANFWPQLLNGTAAIQYQVTAYSISGNVLTGTVTATGTETPYANEHLTLGGFGTSTFLNGQTVILTSGSSTSFVAPFTHANTSATEAGTATALTTMLAGAKMTNLVLDSGGSTTNPIVQNWLTAFNNAGWYGNYNPFGYPADEPGASCSGGNSWANVISAATVFHGDTPPGQVQITGSIAQANACSAASSVDLFTVAATIMDPDFASDEGGCGIMTYPYCLTRSTYATWEATGANKIVGSYFGCGNSGTCSTAGNGSAGDSYYNINADGTGVSNRVEEWVTFLHTQHYELYFDDTTCWSGTAGNCPDASPYSSILHFGNNGDGTTTYPGTAAILGSGITTPLVLPSIRLKLRRDGLQDWEYLNLLTNLGRGTFVQTQIRSFINSSWLFNNNPTAAAGGYSGDLNDAYCALGGLMQQQTYASVTPANCEASTGNVTPVGPATTMFAGARIGAAGHAGFK